MTTNILALIFFAAPCDAMQPAYLAQWPEVERVLADHAGSDRTDTTARQVAALNQLDRAIEDMADERRWNNLTRDEVALRGAYRQAADSIRKEMNATKSSDLGPGFHWPWEQAPREAWYSLQWGYESDSAFRQATLSRYLEPDVLAELNARKSASDARARAAGRELLEGLGHREPTWSKIGAAGQDAVALVGLVLVLMLSVMLVREMRRFGLAPDDAMLLRAGFRDYSLSFLHGVVVDYESNTGGYHERFDLWMGWGWYTVGISGAYVAIPDGHFATAVTASPRAGRGEPGYVLFVDHDAASIRQVERVLRGILAPSAWLLVPTVGLGLLIGAVSDPVPGASPLIGAALFAALAWAVGAAMMKWALRRRLRRFVTQDAARVADAAGREAVNPGPSPPKPPKPLPGKVSRSDS